MTTHLPDRTLAELEGCYLTTRSGTSLRLRTVQPGDGPGLLKLFERVSPEERRFRFLDTRAAPNAAELAALLEPDHRRKEHVLAFETSAGEPVASLMMAADESMASAEVAIMVASDRKGRGIGHALLRHALDLARERGIGRLHSIENRANRGALEVERTLGFELREIEDEPTLVLAEAELA